MEWNLRADRASTLEQGALSLADQARVIRGARGQSGANLDYLINTVQHLRALGIRERGLERLMAVAAAHAANAHGGTQHRPSVKALRSTWARRPAPDVRIPIGDQRRFGHRVRLAGDHAQTPSAGITA